MAKTPKLLVESIAEYDRAVEHTEEMIHVKETLPLENQAPHIRAGSPEIWIARLEGQWVMLESLLHRAHCYAGFMYVSKPVRQLQADDGTVSTARYGVGPDHAEYRDWARTYFTKA